MVVAPQGLQFVGLRGEDPAGLGQAQAQRPQHEGLLQAQRLALLVGAVAVRAGQAGGRRPISS
ncbi:hypothetical protein AC230_22220 [Streptomyces caatingaensis]|uniref:Uncharacterized protein n=1 Tax=Streptomyces caatingaensis TaxID=1678637 RepID=A0A0K9XB48_9ACTN|nr:hypothetical protein AC230_22220 [Streptomyces caatingaensis]